MALAVAGQNGACDGVAALWAFSSLHTGDPSTTGANEATGGSYARQATTWAAASSGQRATGTSALTFPVPAGTFFWVGGFTLVTAGTFLGAFPLGGITPKQATVVASTDFFTSPGHLLANDDRCVVFDINGSGVPAGLTEGTTYFVVGVSGTTFQLSATQGGAAVNVTADGTCWIQKSVPETFNFAGTLSVPIGSGILSGLAA
jgi:hypothetical protein